MNREEMLGHRRERLRAVRALADNMTSNLRLHESVKRQVAKAVQDLHEAEMWLQRASVESPRALAEIGFATYQISLAEQRLDSLEQLIHEHGEMVQFLG